MGSAQLASSWLRLLGAGCDSRDSAVEAMSVDELLAQAEELWCTGDVRSSLSCYEQALEQVRNDANVEREGEIMFGLGYALLNSPTELDNLLKARGVGLLH